MDDFNNLNLEDLDVDVLIADLHNILKRNRLDSEEREMKAEQFSAKISPDNEEQTRPIGLSPERLKPSVKPLYDAKTDPREDLGIYLKQNASETSSDSRPPNPEDRIRDEISPSESQSDLQFTVLDNEVQQIVDSKPAGNGNPERLRPIYNVYIIPNGSEYRLPEMPQPSVIPEAPPAEDEKKQKPKPKSETKDKSEGKKSKFSYIGNAFFYVVLIVFVIGVVFFSNSKDGSPKSFAGFSAFVVLTSSMESEIPKGSLVITRTVDPSTLQVGDDITYLANPTTTITHRIIDIFESYESTNQRAFKTQGVMNEEPDKLPVPAANVVGKVVYHNYTMGKVVDFISKNWIIILIMLVLVFAFFTVMKIVFRKGDDEEEEQQPPPEKNPRKEKSKESRFGKTQQKL